MSELDEIMYQIKVYDDEYEKNMPDEWRMSLDNGKHYGKATQVYDFTKHRYIVKYVSDNYDIHTEIQTLLQENKQLKERFERLKQEHIDTITRNEEKQQRIDKAIDYIKTTDRWLCRVNDNLCVETIGKDKLLEILGDKENE